MKGYIYKYTFPDGKIYIGQTRRQLEMRHSEHISPTTGPLNPGFWEAYQKYGEPELTILETVEENDLTKLINELNRLETIYIHAEKATNPQYGYNRKTIATTYIPDNKILINEFDRILASFLEEKQPFFDDITQKLFERRESELTKEERWFVDSFVYNNNLFFNKDEYNNHTSQEEVDGGDDSYIEDFILEEALDYAVWYYTEKYKEFFWLYVLENADSIIKKSRQGKIILQLDKDGNIIREFSTLDEIREAFNIKRIDNITNVLKGRQKSAYGYYWRYKSQKGG